MGSEVWWQYTVKHRPDVALDPGEVMVKEVLADLGVQEAAGRADVAVRRAGEVVAFVECKWFEDVGRARDAAFDGVAQVVQYARDYTHEHGGASPDPLIARSLLAVAQRGALPRVVSGRRIACLDLDDIEAGWLGDWVSALP